MIRYRVVLTAGDEFGYNKEGDVFYINEDKVEDTLKNGFSFLKLFHYAVGDDAIFRYPCKVFEEHYEKTDEICLGKSECKEIGKTRSERDNYDWKDHWP